VSDFLSTVLPSVGNYCLAIFSPQVRRHKFFPTVEALDASALPVLANSVDLYFALASFGDNRTRKAEAAQCMRSLFIDLDCGPKKPYLDQAAAAQALRAFIATTKFPQPTYVVNSGGGLHVYWAFDRDLEIPQWYAMATGLKRLCHEHDLHADPQITADAARVLRIPGTFNHKYNPPAPVQIMYRGKVHTPESVEAKLPEAPVDLSAARAFGVDDTTKELARGNRYPSFFAKIVSMSAAGNGCAQIHHAVQEQASLEEPLWRAALSIATNCDDAETEIHTLSKGHPGYTPEATIEKSQALVDKPYTCEWYRLNYPSKCKSCKHKVTSPIVLGIRIPEAPKEADGSYVIETLQPNSDASDESAQKTYVKVRVPSMPAGYFIRKGGGIGVRTDEGIELEVSPFDLFVMQRYYDPQVEGSGEGESVLLSVNLPKDGMRTFSAPMVDLFSTESLRATLSRHGLVFIGRSVQTVMSYIAAAIRHLQANEASARTINQMGWTPRKTFIIGPLEITTGETTYAQPAEGIRAVASQYHLRGSLEEWQKIIKIYSTPGFEPMAFAFLVGAGSPLLHMMNSPQVKGGVVHLVSSQSGSGKTTVQMAINSIFGHPVSLLQTKEDTYNAKVHLIGVNNSICTTIDEITNMAPTDISGLVYSATSGRGKHRMEAQANKLRDNHTTWCGFTVTSGNAVLSDQLTNSKAASDGELHRLLELRVYRPSKDVPQKVSDLFSSLSDHYGLAGPVYAKYLVNNYAAVQNALRELHTKLVEENKFSRADRFHTAMLACALMAGTILRKLKLVDLMDARVVDYAIRTVRNKDLPIILDDSTDTTKGLAVIANYLNDNINNMLVINSTAAQNAMRRMPEAPLAEPKGALRIRYHPDTKELIIPTSRLNEQLITHRIDVKPLMAQLAAEGSLWAHPDTGVYTKNIRLGAGAQLGNAGVPQTCYVFNAAKLGLDDELGLP
jgi:hypothetical protein